MWSQVICVSLCISSATECSSDLDCQLNGVCTSIPGNQKLCVCDSIWEGDDCGDLKVGPGSVAYGCLPPEESSNHTLACNYTSWGGGPPVFDEAQKKWVLHVSEMAGNCGELAVLFSLLSMLNIGLLIFYPKVFRLGSICPPSSAPLLTCPEARIGVKKWSLTRSLITPTTCRTR